MSRSKWAALGAVVLLGIGYAGYRVWWVQPRSEGPGAEEVAPGFELPDAAGKVVSLDALLSEGPVVVAFYRGFW